MLVSINNVDINIDAHYSIKQVLLYQNYTQFNGIAVAINDVVIAKKDWDSTLLQANDQILVITATAGG